MALINGTIFNDNNTFNFGAFRPALSGKNDLIPVIDLNGNVSLIDLPDTINGLAGHDIINALGTNDFLNGGSGNDILNGNNGNDTLDGGNGNDILNGGTGADNMRGGAGDDTYYVDNIEDEVTETVAGGTDTVNSSIPLYTLGDLLNNLNLTGAAIRGTGNSLNNVINGNSANNILSGDGGSDTLNGGAGADFIAGGAGNDTLTGGANQDSLEGGAGADRFDFNSVSESPSGGLIDHILDFNRLQGDQIDLSTIDANLSLAGNQTFAAAQLSYNAAGILTANVLFGADIQINLVGAPTLNLAADIIA